MSLLYEIPARQEPGKPLKRWFVDDNFDLQVWYDRKQRLAKFKLNYNKGANEHILRWERKIGFRHHRVSQNDSDAMRSDSAMLMEVTTFNPLPLIDSFRMASGNLPEDIRALIHNGILKFARLLAEGKPVLRLPKPPDHASPATPDPKAAL